MVVTEAGSILPAGRSGATWLSPTMGEGVTGAEAGGRRE